MDVASLWPGWKLVPARPIFSQGFTLTEISITLAVMGIVLGLATPSFTGLILDTRLSTHLNTLVSDFNLARSEAIKRNSQVVICKSHDGTSCVRSGGWEQGWLLFADTNCNRYREASEPLIHVAEQAIQTTIHYSAFGSRHYVVYYPRGFTRTNGTFTFCDNRGSEKAKAMVVYKTGRIRSSATKPNGDPLECP